MLRDRVNVSEKVAALEALLERVQRNAAEPRPPRSDVAAQVLPAASPALAAQEPPADSLSDWAVSSISPVLDVKPKAAGVAPSTAPYPVMKDAASHTPLGPPVIPVAAAPAAKRPELEPSPISAWPDIGPPSYPTLPGIAGPPVRPAAAKAVSIAASAQPPAPPPPPPEENSEAITIQAGALRPAAAAFEPAEPQIEAEEKAAPPAAVVPADQARPDRSAVIRTLPGVGLEQGDEGKKPEDKLAEAVGSAQAGQKALGAKPAADRKAAAPAAATPKPAPIAPVAPLPKAPETPAAAKPALAAKTPALAPIKSPLVSLPKRPLSTPSVAASPPAAKSPAAPAAPSPAALSPLGKPSSLSPLAPLGTSAAKHETPKAPHAKAADAAKAAGHKLGIEPPPAVIAAAKNLSAKPAIPPSADSDDSMATTIDVDESPTARPIHADEMTRPLASLPAEKAPEKALPRIENVSEEDTEGEEATVMKTSPLEAIKVAKDEPEESADEPTLMRPSPLEAEHAEKEEPEEGGDEPTLMRPSPVETASDLLLAAKEIMEPGRAAKAAETKAAPSPEAPPTAETEGVVPPLAEPLFSPEIQPPAEQTETTRDTVRPERRKARRAPWWGFALAALALAGAGVVVAVDKGWIGRFVEPTVNTSTPSSLTGTAAPQTPTQTATAPQPTVSASQDVGTPVPEQGDAGADTSDAGVNDASVSDAAIDAEAPDAAAPDAAAPDAAAPAAPPTSEPSAAAPPGDPAALPDKKGYLTITSAPSLHVYVQGAHAGLTNEALVVDCGPKFVRLGEPPATPPAGGGLAGVKWRSEGKSVVVACKGTTEFSLPASP